MGRRNTGLGEEQAAVLSRFQAVVLAWDYWELRKPRKAVPLRRVPARFSSFKEYVDVFEPLILEECRAQVLRGEVRRVPCCCRSLRQPASCFSRSCPHRRRTKRPWTWRP
jgi:hypothetical protein